MTGITGNGSPLVTAEMSRADSVGVARTARGSSSNTPESESGAAPKSGTSRSAYTLPEVWCNALVTAARN